MKINTFHREYAHSGSKAPSSSILVHDNGKGDVTGCGLLWTVLFPLFRSIQYSLFFQKETFLLLFQVFLFYLLFLHIRGGEGGRVVTL